MAYSDYIGREYEPFTVDVEKGRIRFFADAIGEEDPIYRDEEAARAAGYPGIPVPPTFPFTITMDADQSFNILHDMGIPVTKAVHGAQSFTYHRPICAGDVITGRQRVADVFEKKGGALLFIIAETALENERGEHVCDLQSTIVVRNG
jgi:acyl dehydratase